MQDRQSHVSRTFQVGVTTAALLTLLFPQAVFADLNDLQNQQSKQQQELDNAKERERQARENKEKFQKEINVNAEEINNLSEQIDVKETEIANLQSNISAKTQQIDTTKTELAEAEKRVTERNKLLRQRLRMMYERGEVNYLEVLLNSTSFTDFLDRFDALSAIFEQDTELLKKNKEDRDLIASKKQQLEEEKDHLTQMKAQQQDQKAQLDTLKSQKQAINAQLETNKSEQERIEQEQQQIQEQAVRALFETQKAIDAEKHRQNTAKQPTPGSNGGSSNGSSQHFTGPFTWPVPSSYAITSEWGNRTDPFTGYRAGHNGMDIGASSGTPVVAAQSGTVIRAGFWAGSGFGNCIIVDHGGGLWTLYGHLVNGGVLVSVGQEVNKGDVIGKVGSTGRSTGPHLHFGVYQNGSDINPRQYL